MENWTLRRAQVRAIVGTADPAGLNRAVAVARAYVAHQPAVEPADARRAWQFVGPSSVSGRVTALALDPRGTGTLYAGSAAGGVFKTTDGGDSWTALWSRGRRSLAVGGLGLCAARPEVVYAATGEWEGRVSSTTYHHFAGGGVHVTDDGGATWRACGPVSSSDRRASRWTSAVSVDPADPARVFVAGDRGLHRSIDFGNTWNEVLVPNPEDADGLAPGDMVVDGAVTDVAIDPDAPHVVYAAAHRRGVFRSDRAGDPDSFRRLLLPGVAEGDCESPRIAFGPRIETGVRLVVVLTAGRVFTSRDGGITFAPVATPIKGDVAQTFYPWCTAVAVHPSHPGVILAGHGWLWRTLDGGATRWERHGAQPLRTGFTHSDIQAIAFDPSHAGRAYVATDGGVYRTRYVLAPTPLVGGIWEPCSRGLTITQCYTVAVSAADPFRIGTTTQDLGAYVCTGESGANVDADRPWKAVHDWEGGWIEFDPARPRAFYLDTRQGDDAHPSWLRHTADDGESWTTPGFPDSRGTPFQSDCTIREALAVAARRPAHRLLIARLRGEPPARPFRLYRSTTAGASWDLVESVTRPVAVEITADGQRAYVGGPAGELWCGVDGAWRRLDVTPPLPVLPINDIEIDPGDTRVVFVALGGGDVAHGVPEGVLFPAEVAAVWRIVVSDDGRATAETASGLDAQALPPRLPVTGLEIDPRHAGHLYASHLLGVHHSADGGRTWAPLVAGLPDTFVSDLDLHEPSRTLYAATMGRGIFRLALPS
jgi:photosystem II stability/assembly factor-like uncharacterized protein